MLIYYFTLLQTTSISIPHTHREHTVLNSHQPEINSKTRTKQRESIKKILIRT